MSWHNEINKVSLGNSLYITLHYVPTENEVSKYHWGLFASGGVPPLGMYFHAASADNRPLDLQYKSTYVDSADSESMVVCMRVSDAPAHPTLEACAQNVPLMSPYHLPMGELMWTSRVWVKQMLVRLEQAGVLRLPVSIDAIEQYCQLQADTYFPLRKSRQMKTAKVYNDLTWLNNGNDSPMPMDIDSPSAIDVDSTSPSYDASTSYSRPRTPRHIATAFSHKRTKR
ncbi:hypothetical protein F5X97DRAFT_345152 [Nemania serpens]|nr:hypothetical protein F5X97DRAFT_345152 [Nemania serpens]